MRYMIISDIHGDIYKLNTVLDIYANEKCDKLIVLGDLFNYGIDLNKNDIINRLNLMKENIIYVRGNCDINVSKLEFDTPYFKEIIINGKNTFLTHGHMYSMEYLLGSNYDIIISGHTHIPLIEEKYNKLFLNPGSISKSRRGENSFMIIENNIITIKNLENNIILQKNIVNK